MAQDEVLGNVIREWVQRWLPEEPVAAERAAAVAAEAYRGGASVHEACEEARAFLGSWVRHPSHAGAGDDSLIELAS